MKKILAILFTMLCLHFSFFAESVYQIENPDILHNGSENIITNWDFYWGKFIPPSDTTTAPDITVKAPSDWNKYDLPDEI